MQPAASNPDTDMSNFVRGRGRRAPAGRPGMPAPKRPAIVPAALPVGADAESPPPEATLVAAHAADGIPEPHDPLTDGPLTEAEIAELAACEGAIRAQQLAFTWGVGRALHAISKGRLYRATHARFDAYVRQAWDMSPSRAYEFIDAWPIARHLAVSAIAETGSKVTVGQIRELAPVKRDHGPDGAVMVYEAVAETVTEVDGVSVTAKLLKGVVSTLPSGPLDRSQVASTVRDYLASLHESAPGTSPADLVTAKTASAVAALRDIAGAVGKTADVTLLRQALADIRAALADIEAALPRAETEDV